jgi:2-polyprenyl-3-methyl-5-hydroxy-6-metoxy-1,4-benzoquinol methylase
VESEQRFDARYYERYYRNPRTRATTPQAVKRQAAFVAAYLKHLDLPVRRILDIGCGLGWMLRALQNEYPKARCTGVEYSAHLCRTNGWTRGSVTDFTASAPFDLVVCHDVLPSLDDAHCRAAIANLARLCRGALYLGVLTEEDWDHCDRARTDSDVHLRPAKWYRRLLDREFQSIGGGVFLKRPPAVTLWALESA